MKAIVTFHAISDDQSVISFPRKRFIAFLDALDYSSIPVMSLNDLLQPGVRRGVTITFDDGMTSAFKLAMATLWERKLPAHLFLVTGAVGSTNAWPGQPAGAPTYEIMSWDEVLAAQKMGMFIESHTHNHPDLRKLDDGAMLDEFELCNSEIELRTGRRPEYLAFPYGFRDIRVQTLSSRIYRASMSTQMGYLSKHSAMDALPRIDSYYLRPPWVGLDIGHPGVKGYLAARTALRAVRGLIWNSSHA